MFAEALQTRINSLTNDFSSRDDPYQRARIARRPREGDARRWTASRPTSSSNEEDRRHRGRGAPGRRSSRLAPLTTARVPAPARILIVEDKDSLRTMLRHALERAGPRGRRGARPGRGRAAAAGGAAVAGAVGPAPARRGRLRRAARVQGNRRRHAGHRDDRLRQHRGRRPRDEGRGARLPRQAGRSRPPAAAGPPRARAAPHRHREPADEGGAGGPPRRAAARRRGSVAAQGVRRRCSAPRRPTRPC